MSRPLMHSALITIHVGYNFGSILQTIATCIIFQKHNIEPIVVDYRPDRVTYRRYWKVACQSPFKLLKRIIYYPIYYANRRIYQNFLKRYCKLSAPIYSADNFKKKCPKADLYITGSDQVWNSIHNEGFNDRYLFAGVHGAKIAFASSFGVEKLPQEEFELFKRYLNDYQAISVREKSAQHLVEQMGYKAQHILDPTFLIPKDEWRQYMSRRLIREPYLLLYLPYNISNINEILSLAKNIARQKSLRIITFSWNISTKQYADKTVRFANPGDFLSLMNYADFVITNSFHGTAFAINLNKQFRVFMPSGFGTRIISILELCGIRDKVLVTNSTNTQDIEDEIDYNSVNVILDSERTKANNFIKDTIKQCI